MVIVNHSKIRGDVPISVAIRGADLGIPGAYLEPDPGHMGAEVPALPGPLPDALDRQGLAVSGVKAKIPVGVRDGMPARPAPAKCSVGPPGPTIWRP